MDIKQQHVDGVDVIVLNGELVMASCAEAKTRLAELIKSGEGDVVLDITGVPFVDSSGLSVLVSALKNAQSVGRELVLAGAVAEVVALLELTRLHLVFALYEDRKSALDQLSINAA